MPRSRKSARSNEKTTTGKASIDELYGRLLTDARKVRINGVIEARLSSVTAVLEQVHDPHNLAAVARTAEALGLCAMHIIPEPGSPWRPHRKITQDAHKWLEVVTHADFRACAETLRDAGYRVLAGTLDPAAIEVAEIPGDKPLALIFGNEHRGVSPEALGACDGSFRIDMLGFTKSLNVSVAAGIALDHAVRARRAFLGKTGDLSLANRRAMQRRYYRLANAQSKRIGEALENKPRRKSVE